MNYYLLFLTASVFFSLAQNLISVTITTNIYHSLVTVPDVTEMFRHLVKIVATAAVNPCRRHHLRIIITHGYRYFLRMAKEMATNDGAKAI